MSKKWKPNEITYLKRYSSGKRLDELAQRFKTDVATVKSKLDELGLFAKGSASGGLPPNDPLLRAYEAGVKALYKERWAEAEKQLNKVVDGDLTDLAARARQYLAVCESRRDDHGSSTKTEPYLEAVYLKNRGQIDEALAVCKRQRKPGEQFVYLEASLLALAKRDGEAQKALVRAIDMNPENRVHAFHDPDFADLRQHEEWAQLFDLG